MKQNVYMAASQAEAGHHVAPLAEEITIRCLPPEQILELAQPGDLVIFYSEHFDRFRQTCRELQNRFVATLYLLDGILEWRNAWENRPDEPACPWTMRPVLADKVACLGPSQARWLASWGNRDKIEIVGVPRFDGIPAAHRPPEKQNTFRLLVLTAKCPGFTPEQTAITLRSLRDFRDECPRLTPDGRPVELHWRLAGDLANVLKVENQLSETTGRELSEQISRVDAVVTTPSTAMLEAMLLGRPLALLDYHNAPQLTPAAWTIPTAAHIAPVVAQLSDPPPAKWQLQEYLLHDHLYLAESSCRRFSQLIHGMLEIARDAAAVPRRAEFPVPILPLPQAQTIDFDHRLIYASYPEFSNPDCLRLQADLGHARREIQHLQQQLQQSKAELSEAHRIFEEIHRHPIAGPVVRLRQLVLDKIKAWRDRNALDSRPAKPPEPVQPQ